MSMVVSMFVIVAVGVVAVVAVVAVAGVVLLLVLVLILVLFLVVVCHRFSPPLISDNPILDSLAFAPHTLYTHNLSKCGLSQKLSQ